MKLITGLVVLTLWGGALYGVKALTDLSPGDPDCMERIYSDCAGG